MTDLAAWLLAQIADDEAAARAATPGPWRWTGDYPEGTCTHGEWGNHGPFLESASESVITPWGYDASGMDIKDADADHITRHDPARVLAECAAKKAIVEWHKSWPVLVETEPEFTSDTSDLNSISFAMSQRMMWLTAQEYRARFGDEPPTAPILRLLAQPYADRPGFDPAWKVDP